MRRKVSPPPQLHWENILKTARPRRARRWPRAGRVAFYLGMSLAVLMLVAASLFAYTELKLRAHRQRIEALAGRPATEPMNVLALGSDSRADLTAEEQAKYDPEGTERKTGRRADTIVLLHLDERRKQVVLVHFPRDLRVRSPNGRPGKINGVYQQGPDAMVKTVSEFTGLPIHHFLEVNFSGFNNIVNALGGVEVYFERPIREPDSGLDVPRGCVELKGDQALAFVRIRKIDDDFGRIARQQLFVKLMMDKMTRPGTVLNPVKVVRLVGLFAENVTTDADLSLRDLQGLALRLRDFKSGNVDMRVVPSTGANIRGTSFVIHNERQTAALFAAIRERRPLPDYGRTGVSPLDPGGVRITVLNGTGVTGLAAKAQSEVAADGYHVVGRGDADRSDYERTIVFFKEGSDEKARLVAARYGVEVRPIPAAIVVDSEVALVLGRDYAEGRATPPPPPPAGTPKGQKPLVHECGR